LPGEGQFGTRGIVESGQAGYLFGRILGFVKLTADPLRHLGGRRIDRGLWLVLQKRLPGLL
jgi:hypothetical protein